MKSQQIKEWKWKKVKTLANTLILLKSWTFEEPASDCDCDYNFFHKEYSQMMGKWLKELETRDRIETISTKTLSSSAIKFSRFRESSVDCCHSDSNGSITANAVGKMSKGMNWLRNKSLKEWRNILTLQQIGWHSW